MSQTANIWSLDSLPVATEGLCFRCVLCLYAEFVCCISALQLIGLQPALIAATSLRTPPYRFHAWRFLVITLILKD